MTNSVLAVSFCFPDVYPYSCVIGDVQGLEYGLKSKTFSEFFKYLLDSDGSLGY